MADIQHRDIPHADCHEPRWLGVAVAADAGKVITASAVDGVSEFRKLTFGEITSGNVKASFLTIVDDTDTTKKAVFVASGITAATTRTLTIPNATGTLVLRDDTATLSNKRITPRISTVTYSATLNINSDNFDELFCASLTGNVAIAAPTGTPTEGQRLTIKLTQDGAGGRTITYNAAFVTSGASTTTLSTTETRVFEWNVNRAKWIQVSVTTGI